VTTTVDDRAIARRVACRLLLRRSMKETRPRKKLVLTTEVLRTLVVGGTAKAEVSQIPRPQQSQFDSCGIVCGITRQPAKTEAPAACMKTWGMTCPDVIR
jgi:hypothetical protein